VSPPKRESLTLKPYVRQISARSVLQRKALRWNSSTGETVLVIGDVCYWRHNVPPTRVLRGSPATTRTSVIISGDAESRHLAFCETYSLIYGALTAYRRLPAPTLIDGGYVVNCPFAQARADLR
jgi:hypothetical protein